MNPQNFPKEALNFHSTAWNLDMEAEEVQIRIGNYIVDRTIGEGAFSKVRLGLHIPTQIRVAVKLISKGELVDEAAKTRFRREMGAFSHSDHPFIAKFFEILEDDDYMYLVQEMAQGGNMLDSVNARGELDELEVRKYFAELLSAMEYLHHTLHVMHRDLKAENVLLDKYDNIRLIDFGLCNILQDETQFMKTACGSPAYAPPEMIQGLQYNHSADTWSMGVFLYAIADTQLPFDDPNVQRLLQKIVYTEPKYPDHFSPELTDLLKRMLCKNPNKRITMEEIKEHEFIRDYLVDNRIDLVQSMINREEIMENVMKIGYDRDEVEAALEANEPHDGAVAFMILHRKKMTECLRQVMSMHVQEHATLIPMTTPAVPAPHQVTAPAEQAPIPVAVAKRNSLTQDAPIPPPVRNMEPTRRESAGRLPALSQRGQARVKVKQMMQRGVPIHKVARSAHGPSAMARHPTEQPRRAVMPISLLSRNNR